MRLVDLPAGERGHQGIVAHLVAKPGDHRGHLRVEQRARRVAEFEHEDLDVLARGVEHLGDCLVGQQPPERGQIEALGQRVHHRHLVRAGQLHHAEFGPIGPFAHEFGIDGDEALLLQPRAESVQSVGRCDQIGGRKFRPGGARHAIVIHVAYRVAKRRHAALDRGEKPC